MKLQMHRSSPLALLVVIASVIVVAGCGGGSSFQAPSGAPHAKESLRAYAERYASLVNSGSCANLAQSNKLTGATNAPPCAIQRAKLSHFKITGAASFGTGGVIDFTDAANPAGNSGTYLVAVGQDGQWHVLFNPAGAASVGTTPPSAAPFTATLTAFFHAVKTRNCAGVFKYALSPPGQSQSQFCRLVLTPGNVADAAIKPVPLGGTKVFQFYALSRDTRYATIAVGHNPSAHPPYLVVGSLRAR